MSAATAPARGPSRARSTRSTPPRRPAKAWGSTAIRKSAAPTPRPWAPATAAPAAPGGGRAAPPATRTPTTGTNHPPGGASGSGGAQSDTDGYTITIIGINDAPVVSGDGTESLAATNEDVADAALTNTVSVLFSGQYSDPDTDTFAGVAVTANGSTAGTGAGAVF